VVQFAIGPANRWLVAGANVLALEARNAEQPSTTSAPEQITQHTPTPEFLINAGLQETGDTTNPLVDFVKLGSAGGAWAYFIGRVEPSGGVIDLGLATKPFTPPTGEEDDYDQPAAFGDWIELYNDGTNTVDLTRWSLTDDSSQPGKWRFPTNTVLGAGAYLVVMCDNRDEANAPAGPAARLHTNFKLNDTGDFLGLCNPAGQFVDGLPAGYPQQVFNCSYGRSPTNPAAFVYLATATPGTNNAGPIYYGQAPSPLFQDAAGNDLHGGIYLTQPLTLILNCLMGAQIRYTFDATEPTEATGFVYTNPLVLTQSSDQTGIVVRARAFLPGLLPSETKTHTYLLRQPVALAKAPTLIFTGDPQRTFYAPWGLLAIVGGQYVPVSSGSFWQATGPNSYNEVLGDGLPFEREAHLEFYFPSGFYPTNQEPLRTDIGLRVSSSSYSRPRMRLTQAATSSPWPPWDSTEKPSFNLHFVSDYGPGELDYPLFPNYSVKDFQYLRLRAGKNDIANPFITDELVRRLWLDMGQVGARGLFCSLYLNGVYKGVFNLCERFREPFFQEHYRSTANWDVDYSWAWVDGDSTVFQQLLTALDQNLTNQVNWAAVTNKLDVDNAADYFLLNIYCATWDWPGNNFVIARERSAGPDSRFRFAVWDAEGAFNAIGYAHPASYNTITNDLIVPSSNPSYWWDLPRVFRRLSTSPEFRLLFADHINQRLFNGGILDDRDPDGAGPLQSRFASELRALILEAATLVAYNTSQGLDLSSFNAWTATAGGRRSYLLGPTSQMLRDAGFWPVTEPPVFNQFGGTVPPGFGLTMTSIVAVPGQIASIYYCTDGSDPRRVGGARNSAAQLYTGPVSITNVVAVKARAQNNSTGEWSPLTAALFAPAAVPASATNLALAELMYHPPDATQAEAAAGYNNADDFEFVRLLNIGSVPVDLAGVRFTMGVTYDFTGGAVRYLTASANVLAVKNRDAFQLRYGHGCDALIAGEYSGSFDNNGERVQLVASNGVPICDFTYNDSAPWPASADGQGLSLILNNPQTAPNPNAPTNWSASAIPGGLPSGAAPVQSYATWRALFWDDPLSVTNNAISGPAADPDGDGICNFVEYAFGLDPHRASVPPRLQPAIESTGGQPHVVVQITLAPGAQDAQKNWETSPDLRTWAPAGASIQLISLQPCLNGTAVFKYLDSTAISTNAIRFIRMKITGP
jgi:hypothetical protein